MKFSDVMVYFDFNMTNIARALNITTQSVSCWHKSNKIPILRAYQLESITNGALKVNTSNEDNIDDHN